LSSVFISKPIEGENESIEKRELKIRHTYTIDGMYSIGIDNVGLYTDADLGTAKASAQYKDKKLSIGAMASIWTPSLSIKIWDVNIVLSAHVGSVGSHLVVGDPKGGAKKGFKFDGAAVWGFGVSVAW
jgi:hypothetical protein